jgi:hypothetical protein
LIRTNTQLASSSLIGYFERGFRSEPHASDRWRK